jgi:hypothetical protein
MNQPDAVQAGRQQPPCGRFLWRLGSLLFLAIALVLAAFGIFFTFANYPAFGIGLTLLILLLIGSSEHSRRKRRRARESARKRTRTERTRDLSGG